VDIRSFIIRKSFSDYHDRPQQVDCSVGRFLTKGTRLMMMQKRQSIGGDF
jgi:hypothetical protein